MAWTEGYVSEINYTYGFYGELSPLKLALACAIKAIHPPDTNQPFNYCELACGRGYTTNLLASCYPQAQFYANDFNPNHIHEAKKLALSAGSQNVHFFDDSFSEFLYQDLPQFDFIVLHGTYSWISAENRRLIVEFIRKKLNVGGLVYISYNALPGWAGVLPLRELMVKHKQHSTQRILNSIEEALNFTGQLIENNAGYFTQNQIVKSRYDNLKSQNRHYLAHEYFNQDWNCFYFDQVVKELEDAKLSYVGSANIIDNIEIVNLSPEAQAQLRDINDPIYREVVRDFYLNTVFRKDIFARGQVNTTSIMQNEIMSNMRYALTLSPKNLQLTHLFPVGEVTLDQDVYPAICSALSQSPLTMTELQNHRDTKKIPSNNLYEALMVLTGLDYIHPVVDEETYRKRKLSTDKFNLAVQKMAFSSDEMNFLASPLTGNGIGVNPLEQLLLYAKSRDNQPIKFVWEIFRSQNKKFIKDDKVLETSEENIAHLEDLATDFYLNRFPILESLGI